ncbi:MAG TPA: hypothetical protein VK083_23105 [Nocardia sp.]|uniref:hypothetical protein n=1 Tax=Nocardia TaxID=1817 RepID=UPI00245707D0|nr:MULTISPECIES: hypothetical protein [Nocardia]HLS79682.1 hypothetical protein [Nocardia sp.]
MTNEPDADIAADVEDQIRVGEELLNSGETEELIRQAAETITLARDQGRLDIVEQAGAIIRELTAQHEAVAQAQADLIVENANLRAATDMLRAAEAHYAAAVEALGEEK